MTDSSKKVPTASGWWWAKDELGEVNAIKVIIFDGRPYDANDPLWPYQIKGVEWLGPVIPHDEGEQLRMRVAELEAERARVLSVIEEVQKSVPEDYSDFNLGHNMACNKIYMALETKEKP
jgi:hypothetical protein